MKIIQILYLYSNCVISFRTMVRQKPKLTLGKQSKSTTIRRRKKHQSNAIKVYTSRSSWIRTEDEIFNKVTYRNIYSASSVWRAIWSLTSVIRTKCAPQMSHENWRSSRRSRVSCWERSARVANSFPHSEHTCDLVSPCTAHLWMKNIQLVLNLINQCEFY